MSEEKKKSWSEKTSSEKEYHIRRIVGLPFAAIVAYLIYHFLLINWFDNGWAIGLGIIIFLTGYGYWIEQSNKSQFYETHKEKIKYKKEIN